MFHDVHDATVQLYICCKSRDVQKGTGVRNVHNDTIMSAGLVSAELSKWVGFVGLLGQKTARRFAVVRSSGTPASTQFGNTPRFARGGAIPGGLKTSISIRSTCREYNCTVEVGYYVKRNVRDNSHIT